MKVEFLKDLGLTEEQISKIQAESGKDIQKEKDKYLSISNDLENAKKVIDENNKAIKDLEAVKGDSINLQNELEKLQLQIKQRDIEEASKKEKAETLERFNKIMGEKEFAHDYIKNGVFEDFQKALKDDANKGKGDLDIFTDLTKDKEGIFKSQNPSPNMGNMGDVKNQEVIAKIPSIF